MPTMAAISTIQPPIRCFAESDTLTPHVILSNQLSLSGVSRGRILLAGAVALLLAVGAILVVNAVSHPAETRPLDPNPTSAYRIAALGDSFISGEGAQSYFPGTDVSRNMCHRAATAYPYLVAERMDASLSFIACSGAKTEDVTGFDAAGKEVPGQHPNSPEDVYGGLPQVQALRKVAPADVVLISIGGNDAGFAEIGIDCATPLFPDCRRLANHWLHRLDSDVYPALVRTYAAVRKAAAGAPVFALTYPNPIGPKFCDDLVGLRPAEMAFLRDVFVKRLNEIVEAAARVAGVRVIDLTNALRGYRFCEAPLGKTAVNFIEVEHTVGTPIDVTSLGGLVHGSLHPNRLGHELMEKVVLERLEALRAGHLKSLPPPPPDTGPPPFVPEEIGSPAGPTAFPPGTDCSGTELTLVTLISADPDRESVPLAGLRPHSTVCFRTYRAEWELKRVDSTGTVEVPVDVSPAGVAGINEILVEEPGGAWKKLVVSRLGAADVG